MFKTFITWMGAIAAVLIIISFFLPVDIGVAILSGYFLSTMFSASGLWIIQYFFEAEQSIFVKAFFFSLTVRFFLVIVVLGLLLGLTKIDEIYFTVSFLISYLCQSVTEMIFFNNSLQKNSNQKQ